INVGSCSGSSFEPAAAFCLARSTCLLPGPWQRSHPTASSPLPFMFQCALAGGVPTGMKSNPVVWQPIHFCSAEGATGNSSGFRGMATPELFVQTQFSGWKLTTSQKPDGWPALLSGFTDQRIGAGKKKSPGLPSWPAGRTWEVCCHFPPTTSATSYLLPPLGEFVSVGSTMTKKYLPLLLSVLTSNFTGTSCNFPKSASPPLATARTSLNGTMAPLKSPRT